MESDLQARLRRLIERQRDQRGDYLYRGDADTELVEAAEGVDSLLGEMAALKQDFERTHERETQFLNENIALATERDHLLAEIARRDELIAPFVEAAKMGVLTYEAVRAANLRQQGLSAYETVYVGAGSHAAQSRVSYADWARLAALQPSETPKEDK